MDTNQVDLSHTHTVGVNVSNSALTVRRKTEQASNGCRSDSKNRRALQDAMVTVWLISMGVILIQSGFGELDEDCLLFLYTDPPTL